MGSESSALVPLLSYVLVLDLGILFLAYYRKWFFLDIIALAGTAIISIVAFNMDWQVWYGQAFLMAYFLLFIGVAVIYNNQTRSNLLSLLLANSLFFSIFSFVNLFDKLTNWLGLIALTFAAIYLGLYVRLNLKGKITPVFAKALLLLAFVFSLLIAPFQLDGVYCQIAWLAAAAIILYFSDLVKNKAAFFIALLIVASTFTYVLTNNQGI